MHRGNAVDGDSLKLKHFKGNFAYDIKEALRFLCCISLHNVNVMHCIEAKLTRVFTAMKFEVEYNEVTKRICTLKIRESSR